MRRWRFLRRGAIGLMQLLPGTAAEMGVDPDDPEQNVLGGARYLAMLPQAVRQRHEARGAAYNTGMKNVDKAGSSNFRGRRSTSDRFSSHYDSLSTEVQGGPCGETCRVGPVSR